MKTLCHRLFLLLLFVFHIAIVFYFTSLFVSCAMRHECSAISTLFQLLCPFSRHQSDSAEAAFFMCTVEKRIFAGVALCCAWIAPVYRIQPLKHAHLGKGKKNSRSAFSFPCLAFCFHVFFLLTAVPLLLLWWFLYSPEWQVSQSGVLVLMLKFSRQRVFFFFLVVPLAQVHESITWHQMVFVACCVRHVLIGAASDQTDDAM